LKAKVTREQTSDCSDSQGGSDEDVDEEEEEAKTFNLMARNFQKFFRKGIRFERNNRFGNGANRFGRGHGNCFGNKGGESSTQKELAIISDSEEGNEPKNDTTCLMAIDSQEAYDGGHAIFGSNLKGKVVDGGNISHDSITITNVEHVSDLAFNLISVGQLCDNDCVVSFTKVDCTISKNDKMIAKGHRRIGLYTCKLGDNSKQQICLTSVNNNSTLWHRRLGHAKMRLVQNLGSNELVMNLPKLSFERHFYDACGLGSQGNANNRTRNEVSTSMVLELLDLDLFGPSPIQSYGGNFYTLMIVYDHLNYTWVVFVESKDDVLEKFKILCKRLENLHDFSIVSIVTNHSSEFDKLQFGSFCEQHGMSYNLLGPFTSQPIHLTKFDPKSYEGVFLGYSQTSKANILLNEEIIRIEESLNVTFDESLPEPKSSSSIEDDWIIEL
ncbi:retrovirus-related pol polyprotein from transposon TNT 1-94, partial [Tanacetum coccineum]